MLKTIWVCLAAALVAGCGESLVCQVEVLVAISEPSGIIAEDGNPSMDGIQTDVTVQTTLARGVELELTVEREDGTVLTVAFADTDRDGNAEFEDVTVPAEGARLRVFGDAGRCGFDDDVRSISVTAGAGCEIAFADPPVANDFYAPLDVFDAGADGDAATPGYQGDLIVRAPPGHEIQVFVSSPGVLEQALGSGTAGDSGELRLAASLPEGQDNVRAECSGPGGAGTRSSGSISVFVDTVAPTCAMTVPVPGTSITPALDADDDLDNGVQLTLTGQVDGNDVAGEATLFTLMGPVPPAVGIAGTVGAGGDSTAAATFDPAATPADYQVLFSTTDHAGNPCLADETYRVVYDGCPITVIAPTGTVTMDADGTAANGAQVDLVLDVDDACVGRPIVSDCGSNDASGVVGPGGATTLRADLCDGVPCETSELCTVRVTSADGIETTAGVNLSFDNQPPSVSVQVAQPAGVGCGGTVTPAQDVDLGAAGTQIVMRVVSPAAATRQLRITATSGTTTVDASGAGGEVTVTLENGANDFVGLASDAAGNSAMTATCRVSLADLAVSFTGPAADGTVGGADGTVAAGSLTFMLTGTVSSLGATVDVRIDGGMAQPAVVVGTSWSLPLTLAERAAPYVVLATATAGPRVGSATLNLVVDLTGPSAAGGVSGTADTRRSIRLSFTAPSDGGAAAAAYRVRYATTALTDANFDTTGTSFAAPPPAAPGTAQTVRVTPLRTGTPFWVGIAAVDGAGNRSAAQIVGPLTPRFDATAAISTPGASLGHAMVRGRFNDDAFDDLAIASPFTTVGGVTSAGEVHVYLGSASGLASSPAVTIRGTTDGGSLGSSLTAVRWSSPTRDDLVIGEPFGAGTSGAIYIFHGGAAFPTGTVNASTAPRRIGVAPAANWFTGSALGWQLATADHDGDGTDDLVATAVFGAAGTAGAAVVFYGGTVPAGAISISDLSAAGSGSAVMRMYEQAGTDLFGFHASNLGPTQGGGDAADDLGIGFAEDGVAGADVLVLRATGGRPAAPGVTREPFTVGRDVRLRLATADDTSEWGIAMTSISDQNGDGARDIVSADFRAGADAGVVMVIDGDTTGTAGLALTSAPGVVLTEIRETGTALALGTAVLPNADEGTPDVDGDGIEDLVVAGRGPGAGQSQIMVWFGPLAAGLESPAAPDHAIVGPAGFTSALPSNGGTPVRAVWGDVNGDGLADIVWSDKTSAGNTGGFQVLWDDGV